MSDSETLRAAAEVLRRREWPNRASVADKWADAIATQDAAAERDRKLGLIAAKVYYAQTEPANNLWLTVARAVREAIEAEQ